MKKGRTGNRKRPYPGAENRNISNQPALKITLAYPLKISLSFSKEFRRKLKFLDKHIFYGLRNLNNGFDAASIKYFNGKDFKIVLDRVEQHGLGIYGIEPWKNDEFFWVKTVSDDIYNCTGPRWYSKAFEEFLAQDDDLQYAASYYIPEKYLRKG